MGFATLRSNMCQVYTGKPGKSKLPKLVTVILMFSPCWTHLRVCEGKVKAELMKVLEADA